MWRAVTEAVGIAARDSLWDYPDLMPSAADIDDPAALISRLQAQARGDAPERDEIDEALDALLAEASSESAATSDDGATHQPSGELPGGSASEEDATDADDTEGDSGSAGPRPV